MLSSQIGMFLCVKFSAISNVIQVLKQSKKDKYLDLASELKKHKLWNMKVIVIPVVIGMLKTISKGLEMGSGRVRNWRTNRDH